MAKGIPGFTLFNTCPTSATPFRTHAQRHRLGQIPNWMTLIANAFVPLASMLSSATVAIWTKRIDARNKAETAIHECVLDFDNRAAGDSWQPNCLIPSATS
ncbi:hypothetical protein EI067_28440 [Mycobacterium paragordonae]|nr:hypothetical protein EI067_28440 [Mycobacterium paragordonae]